MKNSVISILTVVLLLVVISCTKANKPYSKVESIASINGGDVFFNCFYSYSRFDKLAYGICWSDSSETPKRLVDYGNAQAANYYESNEDRKSGSKTLRMRYLPRGTTLWARTYIKFDGGSTLYSDETIEFKTGNFHDMGCYPNENELLKDDQKKAVNSITYANTGNSQIEIQAELNNYSVNFIFQGLPERTTGYEIVGSNSFFPYEDQVRIKIKDKNTGCDSYIDGSNYLYVNIVSGNTLYIQFCNATFWNNCAGKAEVYGGLFKVDI